LWQNVLSLNISYIQSRGNSLQWYSFTSCHCHLECISFREWSFKYHYFFFKDWLDRDGHFSKFTTSSKWMRIIMFVFNTNTLQCLLKNRNKLVTSEGSSITMSKYRKTYISNLMGTTCVCKNLLQTHVVPIKLDIYIFLSFECGSASRRLLQTRVVPITWWVRRVSVITFTWHSHTQKTGKRRYLTWWVRRVSVITFTWYSHTQKTGKRSYLTWFRYLRFPVFWVCEYQVKIITETRRTHQVRYLRFPVFWVYEYQMKVITDTRRTHQVRYHI
jgi:hypothetical protein